MSTTANHAVAGTGDTDGKPTNWPKPSALRASLIGAVVLGPAAAILGIYHAINHGARPWWVAAYVAGFGVICAAMGVWGKASSIRNDKLMDAAYTAAKARGASDDEIFDLLLHAPPEPPTTKLRDALYIAGMLAIAGVITWILKYLVT
ncbi:hypothetical protein ABH935_007000 [Catenulispora sp. GAS73]|uniref:hypothetical protein n=1 Tax=Catenulispora sp. GAS73 TaxID=3156269 RepID=UPI003514BFD1